ncbi:MAG TPA: hypothetical protein VIJ62_08880 [Rhizomicrobium sp.]
MIDAFENTPAIRDAFEGVEVRFCNLPPEKDIYIRGVVGRQASEFGNCAGPNWLFFETMKGLKSEFRFVFQMESDCYPVAPNWLTKIEQICVDNTDAWVIGTQYCGVSPLSPIISRHINGNALYNIGEAAYWRFLDGFMWPWMHRQIKTKNTFLCYDCAWEHYLHSIATENSTNQARAQARRNLPRFRLKNFIVNVAGRAEMDGNYIWTKAELLKQYPNAVVIHGPFVTTADHLRGGLALGKPVVAPEVTTEASKLKYTGPNERGKTRYERTIWLPGKALDSETSVHLEITASCASQGSGVVVELLDEARAVMGRKVISCNADDSPNIAQFECTMNLPHSYVYLALRFFGADDVCTVSLSDAHLEVRRWETVLAKTDHVFD